MAKWAAWIRQGHGLALPERRFELAGLLLHEVMIAESPKEDEQQMARRGGMGGMNVITHRGGNHCAFGYIHKEGVSARSLLWCAARRPIRPILTGAADETHRCWRLF